MSKSSEYDRLYNLYKNKPFSELETIANSEGDDYVAEAKRVAKDILVEQKQEYQEFKKNIEVEKVKNEIIKNEDVKKGKRDVVDELKNDWSNYEMMGRYKPSERVIRIAWATMIAFLILGVFAFIIVFSSDKKYIWIALSALLGLVFAGEVVFAVLYSLGHILKNNEKMNEKIDELIEK